MSNLKFYMTPGSCSTGIHILLEELGLVFEAHVVNLPAGDTQKPEYLAMNPKGTIPVLVTKEGKPINDFAAIAYWLAAKYPKAGLWPAELDEQIRVLEVLNYAVGTLHMQAFTRIFTPDQYVSESREVERCKAQGENLVRKGFAIVERWLQGREFVVERFSIADAALFYVEFWAMHIGLGLPEHCEAHYRRMLERPAVRQVLMEEGYGSLFR